MVSSVIFNILKGCLPYTEPELINNNYTGEIKVLGKTNIGVAPERYVPDISKIIKELGVKENYTLEAAIKRTIEYYKGL